MNLSNVFPHVIEIQDLIVSETIETIKMLLIAGSISAIIGLLLALGLLVFRKNGLKEIPILYNLISAVVNLTRALPFVILLFAIIPLIKLIGESTVGMAGSIVPLVCATAPFFARQFETALLEVNPGVIEAAQSMGASDMQIIVNVYLSEALGGIIRATTITLVNLLGLTTMVGAIGGGGIGNLALIYGHRRNWLDVTYTSVVIILILVYVIQICGNLAHKLFVKGE